MRSLLAPLTTPITNKAPVPYVARRQPIAAGLLASSATGDREAQARTMTANGTLFAIVGGIAVDVSAVEWKLWRPAKSGKVEDRTEVTSHAALDVWDQPNPFMSRQEYVEVVEQHLGLTGEGWNLFSRARMVSWPVELWPIYPHRMYPVPDPKKFLAGYVYMSPDGEKVPLDTKECALMRQPHPLDVMRGLGTVQAIGTDLDTARAAGEWNRNFFLNSAEPGGIIEAEERLGDDEFDEFRTRWAESHRGVSNAHRIAILENGMKWVDRKYTMKDMQFVELRGVSREAIRESYRYPVAMLGESKDVNRAVATAQRVIYAETILVPRLDRWKGFLNRRFLPAFGDTAKGLAFDYESPVPSDEEAENAKRESKANAAKTYIDAGFTGDSVKIGLDLPEELLWEKPDPPAPAPAAGGKPPPTDWLGLDWLRQLRDQDQAGIGAAPEPEEGVTGAPEPDEGVTAADLAGVQADWEAALGAVVTDWQAQVTPAQVDEATAQIEQAVDDGNTAALAAIVVTSAAGAALLEAAMVGMAAAAAARVVAEAAAAGVVIIAGTVAAAELAAAAAATAALLAGGLAIAAGREALRLARPGRTGAEVAREVRVYLNGLSDATLRTQLGAQLTKAQNLGRIATFQAGAGVADADWYATEVLDRNTCLAPEVLVTTRTGPVHAKDVTLDDELLTHSGRWVRPSRVIVSAVDEDLISLELGLPPSFPHAAGLAAGTARDLGSAVDARVIPRTLRLTADHPVLSVRDGLLGWRDAGQLTVGDFVVSQASLEGGGELRIPDLRLGKAPHNVTVPVVGTGRESYRGEVFDFTVPDDETFWAEGVLVHNCTPCRRIDGQRLPTLDAMMLAYGGGGYLFCEGRERCRGTARAVWHAAGPDARWRLPKWLDYDPTQPRDRHGRWTDGAPDVITERAFKFAGRAVKAAFHENNEVTLSDDQGRASRLTKNDVQQVRKKAFAVMDMQVGERDWVNMVETRDGRPVTHMLYGVEKTYEATDVDSDEETWELDRFRLVLADRESENDDPDVFFAGAGTDMTIGAAIKFAEDVERQQFWTIRTVTGSSGRVDVFRDGRSMVVRPVREGAPEWRFTMKDYRKLDKAISKAYEALDDVDDPDTVVTREVETDLGGFTITMLGVDGGMRIEPHWLDYSLVVDAEHRSDFIGDLSRPLEY